MKDILGQEVDVGDIILCREPGRSDIVDSLAAGIVVKCYKTKAETVYIPLNKQLSKWEQEQLNSLLNRTIPDSIYCDTRTRYQIVKLSDEQIEQLRNEKIAPNNRSAE